MSAYYHLFDTAIGVCGMQWTKAGISRLQLPEATEVETTERLLSGSTALAANPPAALKRVVRDIQRLLLGEPRSLLSAPLDYSGAPPFHERVYRAARQILPGNISTYGELAAEVGSPGGARAVGQALGRNPFAIIVPCHRVLSAEGARSRSSAAPPNLGGFSAHGGVSTKIRLLTIEGAIKPPLALSFD